MRKTLIKANSGGKKKNKTTSTHLKGKMLGGAVKYRNNVFNVTIVFENIVCYVCVCVV